jgi:hypothetical protein
MKPIKFCTFQEQESPYFQAFFATKGSFLSWFHLVGLLTKPIEPQPRLGHEEHLNNCKTSRSGQVSLLQTTGAQDL